MGPAIITAFLWRWLVSSKYDSYWSRGVGTAFLKSFQLSLGILVITSTQQSLFGICMYSWQKRNQSCCRDSSCDPCLSDFCELPDKFCFQKFVRCEIAENPCSNYRTWLLGVSEILPVISSIPCTVRAKSSIDLFMMILSFIKTDGVKLLLYCGHKWNLVHFSSILHSVSVQNIFVMPFQYLGFHKNKYIGEHTLFKNIFYIWSKLRLKFGSDVPNVCWVWILCRLA